MFIAKQGELRAILVRFGIYDPILRARELQRYRYEEADPASKEVRLILRCDFARRGPVVVKFKNEEGVTRAVVEEQTAFSQRLLRAGIPTAPAYRTGEGFVLERTLQGCDLLITVEDFCPGEVRTVDGELAEKTGRLLAAAHTVAEREDCHVDSPVLFDPFRENDLFSFEDFQALTPAMGERLSGQAARIAGLYFSHMAALAPLAGRPRYAVQGDIACNNLFLTAEGELGLFDFNRCGDNDLYCDAVMQAVYESRLMDYDRALTGEESLRLLRRFLAGYEELRPFSPMERALFPRLYAVITAFWSTDLIYREDSLRNLVRQGRLREAARALDRMEDCLRNPISI